MGDLRQTGRFQSSGKVMLNWIDHDGNSRTSRGECLDISESGIRVRVKLALAVRTYVTVKFENANLHGAASVRSCVREHIDFIAGLEFTGGMKLTRAVAEAVSTVS